MNIREQVISHDIAKKLKELGIKQKSYFYWIKEDISDFNIAISCKNVDFIYMDDYGFNVIDTKFSFKIDVTDYYSAFTVSELGEMLPRRIYTKRYLKCRIIENTWACINKHNHVTTLGLTEADARAIMLIYLIKNNIIEVHKEKS